MHRAYPSQVRVVVVQRDPIFRHSIVASLQTRSDAFHLVASFDDFEEAKQYLQSAAVDLLITESRFTDAAEGTSGNEDGLALAILAKGKHDARSIFVSNTVNVSDINEAVSRVSPLAYVPVEGGSLDGACEAAFLAALRQCEDQFTSDRNKHGPEFQIDYRDPAILKIDKKQKLITHYNAVAQKWFGLDSLKLDTQPWWKSLGFKREADHPLSFGLSTGIRIAVPPASIKLSDGSEKICTAAVTPENHGQSNAAIVELMSIENHSIEDFANRIKTKDSVAVLGIDQIHYGPNWSEHDNARFLMDLRSGLLEIVRGVDVVSMPMGNAIAITLRDLGAEDSLDVCNALMSHLRSVPPHYGEPVTDVRFCIGLAQRKKYSSSIAALVGGNNAMLAAQLGRKSQRINIASKWDQQTIGGVAHCSDGIFTQGAFTEGYSGFSELFQRLCENEANSEKFSDSLLKLVFEQSDIRKLGVFRRRRDGRYRFVSGGQRSEKGYSSIEEENLSSVFAAKLRKAGADMLNKPIFVSLGKVEAMQPLILRQTVLGFIVLEYEDGVDMGESSFRFNIAQLSLVADNLPGLKKSPDAPDLSAAEGGREANPLDTKIDGYVVDNMEGAVDQATFLAKTDIPVAIIGPRGTGKMYVAKIIHQEWGGADNMIVQIDCRDFRSRDEANNRIATLLESAEGKTLVFKSPHLMAPDAQVKLARQLSTRTLADAKPPRYLPDAKYVALFPDSLEKLVQHSGLSERLASVFAGYPINVPCVKDRKQAVLRWAHKILSQESAAANRPIKGFTPDAEQALLSHEWPGNISEMRQCIVAALQRSEKDWITPVDLGIFKGISANGVPHAADPIPFLSILDSELEDEDEYAATALEDLNVALGEAVHSVSQEKSSVPLGAWLEDEVVLAVLDRYQGDQRLAAEFLHTKPRNIGRWMPKILARQEERNASPIWREPKRFVGDWVRETPRLSEPPQQLVENMLAIHVAKQCVDAKVAVRAKIMGVSVPTYQKRLQNVLLSKELKPQ
ncbi:MAG: sigma 54-interacting transcriptional regulator [Halioglobus sp.]